jgi:hypothetical protein
VGIFHENQQPPLFLPQLSIDSGVFENVMPTEHPGGSSARASTRTFMKGVVPAAGIEPATNGLQNRCSTN